MESKTNAYKYIRTEIVCLSMSLENSSLFTKGWVSTTLGISPGEFCLTECQEANMIRAAKANYIF